MYDIQFLVCLENDLGHAIRNCVQIRSQRYTIIFPQQKEKNYITFPTSFVHTPFLILSKRKLGLDTSINFVKNISDSFLNCKCEGLNTGSYFNSLTEFKCHVYYFIKTISYMNFIKKEKMDRFKMNVN